MTSALAVPVLVVTLTFGSLAALPQREDYAVQSVAMVRQFVEFELRGGRLTAEGWRSAGNRFFLKPEPASKNKEIRVVSDKFYVRLETLTKAPDATVEASFPMCWGRIDPQLHFEAEGSHVPPGVTTLAGCWESYKLVLYNQQWDLGPDGKVRPFTGSTNTLRMRIVDFPKYVLLDRAAAIRYVTEMRDKTTDPVIKKNADKTLGILKKLKE